MIIARCLATFHFRYPGVLYIYVDYFIQSETNIDALLSAGYLAKLKQYDYVKDVDKLEEASYRLLAETLPHEVSSLHTQMSELHL